MMLVYKIKFYIHKILILIDRELYKILKLLWLMKMKLYRVLYFV